MAARRSRRRSRSRARAADPEPPRLSPRELECLRWAAEDKSATDIATIIGRSVHTVKHHLRHAYAKLGVNSRAAAIDRARELRLLARPRWSRCGR